MLDLLGCITELFITLRRHVYWLIHQRFVEPDKAAPEYREAAEQRRAEQIAQRECAMKAELRNVMPRDVS